MDFATPWIPSLDGKVCAPCKSYQAVNTSHPNSVSHHSWAEKTLRDQLNENPKARESLWEGVLALWRLSLVKEQGSDDVNWQNLVSAWLHRHRDICLHLEIAPYNVVSNFAASLLAGKYLPPHMIPAWDQPAKHSDIEPENVPKFPSKTNQKRKATKPPLRIDSDDDVEMAETNPPSIAPSTQRSQGRTPSDDRASIDVEESQVEHSDTGGLKRRHPESPQQARKQPRKQPKPWLENFPPEMDQFDLSIYTVQENSPVSSSMIPHVKLKRCKQCPAPNLPCEPLWHLRKGSFPIQCRYCINFGLYCSFESEDWEVMAWPSILTTQPRARPGRTKAPGTNASLDNKIKETFSHLRGNEDLLSGKWQGDAGTSAENQSGNSSKQADINLHDVVVSPAPTPPLPSIAPGPNPKDHGIPFPKITLDDPFVNLSAVTGRGHSVFLRSFRHFEATLSNPTRTPVTIRTAVAELASISHKERGEAEAFVRLIQGRNAIAAELMNDLLAEARRLEETDFYKGLANSGDTNVAEGTLHMHRRDDQGTTVGAPGETEDVERQLCGEGSGAGETPVSRSGTDSEPESSENVQKSS